MSNESGQTLLEVVAASAVGVVVVTALTFATIYSLRNANFAKNSAQATKLAQEGIEKVRSIRDRDSAISTDIPYPGSSPQRNITKFSELFSVDLSHIICNTALVGDAPCYFGFDANGVLTKPKPTTISETRRQVLIEDKTISSNCGATDYDKYCNQKTITILVTWTDSSGKHESKLTTILRKI